MEANLTFLGEEDFEAAMTGPCREWREKNVRDGEIRSFDGTALHYYYAVPEGARAAIVLLHGFCEFYGKYHEVTWYFYRAGFAFFFLEQRGHGLSGGKLPDDPEIVYVKDYQTYVEDQHRFVDEVVRKESGGLPLLLFAHSMGGAVASLFLEEYPEVFRAACLSSPMLRLLTGGTSPAKISLAKLYMKLFRKGKTIAPGQKRFSPEPIFEKSSTLSRARYMYQFNQRLQNESYRTYGGSFSWLMASFDADKKLLDNAGRISLPITLFTAGADHLIDPAGYDDFCAKVPGIRRMDYPTSKHEIFNADDEVRKQYFTNLISALEEYSR